MARLLSIVLAVPLLGFATAVGLELRLDAAVQRGLHRGMPEVPMAKIATVGAVRFCSQDHHAIPALCGVVSQLEFVWYASLFSIVVPLVLIFGIGFAARRAYGNRALLFAVFVPGFYLTAALVVVLVALHTAIALWSIWLISSLRSGLLPLGWMFMLAIGGIIGVVAIVRSVIEILAGAIADAPGVPITPEQSPRLWALVNDVAARMNALPPQHIVVGTDPRFFVIDARVRTLTGAMLTGRTLYCSLAMSRILTVDELQGIIGHELAHFAGEDTKFSVRFYPIYHGIGASLHRLRSEGGLGFFSQVARWPARVIFSWFLAAFMFAEREDSRTRELMADQAGARVTSAESFATALVKVHAFDVCARDDEEAVEALQAGEVMPNESLLFATRAVQNAAPDILEELGDTHTAHPIDDHPPLAQRLAALGITLEQVSNDALQVNPESSAIQLITDHEPLELAITEARQFILQVLISRAIAANDNKARAA
jgi:Zn-dependent protease with chaperone function